MRNTFLPILMPDEHALSMFSRRLHLGAKNSFQKEQWILSGATESIGILSLDNSALIAVLSEFENECDKETILREHTLVGFYSHSIKLKWIRAFVASAKRKRRKELFVPHSSKYRNSSRWRWCNECIKEDQKIFGVPYWHVEHQLPTSITCGKHPSKKLVFECGNCGFNVKDLRAAPLPSVKCVSCDSRIHQLDVSLSVEQQWVQDRGQELHQQVGSLFKPKHAYDMNYALSLLLSNRVDCRNKEVWQLQQRFQPAFSRWVEETGCNVFFNSDFSFEDDRAVSLASTLMKNRSVSPLSHLLWLKFFGIESFGQVR